MGDNLLPAGHFDNFSETYNPWAGVDGSGNIHGLDGTQSAVGDDGKVYDAKMGPSAAIGDLNGDGKPDIIMADTVGFFWYFPNSGTLQQPKFTQGEILPIWLGEPVTHKNVEGATNVVPRIQVTDVNQDKKLDIVAGTFSGRLFEILNTGSTTQPAFPLTSMQNATLIPTHTAGLLWCDYMAPILFPWFSSNKPDLINGEGTYSANSIYLTENTGTSEAMVFDESHRQKIIPGMGLEQLTPALVNWSNHAKPDIISGDRHGQINLFLNTSTNEEHPTFAPAAPQTIGGNKSFGSFTTVAVGDLTGNKLPNLLIGSDAGTLAYAVNTGKLGAPQFTTPPVTLKGVNPYPTIMASSDWSLDQPYGLPYELLVGTNPQIEPGFTFPPGETTKYALKYYIQPTKPVYFPTHFDPSGFDEFSEHEIRFNSFTTEFILKKRYIVHVWVKCDSAVTDIRLRLWTAYHREGTGIIEIAQETPLSAGTDWTETTADLEFQPSDQDPTLTHISFHPELRFQGTGTVYFDDLSVRAAQ